MQVPGVSHPCGPLPGRAFETAAAAPGAEESAFAARRWTTKAAKSSSPGSIAAVVRVQGHEVGHGRARVGGRRTAVRAGETNGSLERLGLLPAHELAEVGQRRPPACRSCMCASAPSYPVARGRPSGHRAVTRWRRARQGAVGKPASVLEADARTRTGDPFITRQRRVRNGRPRRSTEVHEVPGNTADWRQHERTVEPALVRPHVPDLYPASARPPERAQVRWRSARTRRPTAGAEVSLPPPGI